MPCCGRLAKAESRARPRSSDCEKLWRWVVTRPPTLPDVRRLFQLFEQRLDARNSPAVACRPSRSPRGGEQSMAGSTEDRDEAARLSRQELVRRAGLGLGGLTLPGVAAQRAFARPRAADADTIKIGFVSPRTGPAAG